MKYVGYDGDRAVWRWDLGPIGADGALPTGVLFSNKGSDTLKTDDFEFVNGGYYDVFGLIGKATDATGIVNVNRETITNNQYYTLDGRRVDSNYRGVVIQNGRKVILK